MMSLKKLLCYLNLRFLDTAEEHEYVTTKMPLLKEFFTTLFIALTALLIPYTIRYFQREIFPQSYIIVGLIGLAAIIFCIKKKLDNYLEHLLLGYFVVLIGIFTTVFRDLLPGVDPKEAFYMGYAFAMIHRLVGYQVLKFRYMLILYVFSIVIKFPLINNPDLVLNFIVIVLDLLTLFLCFKSEKMERGLFDSLYKSKKDILKFKHLLTSYLPNQMVIFSNDYSQAHYMNNSFKRAFKCHNTVQVKEALGRYVIEKDTLDKHKNFFLRIGFLNQDQDENSSFSLSNFMCYLAQNVDALRENGMISFPVIEDEKAPVDEQKEVFNEQRIEIQTEGQLLLKNQGKICAKIVKESPDPVKKNLLVLPEPNDSYRSSERGSSKSHSSDFILEEGMKRVYKVKIFPLIWDDKEAIAMVLDDITQQKIIMELKVADQNKDLVIAMVSHELRTPLNGMLGLLDIARKHINQCDALSYLNACRNSGVLMLNLVNSILDMNQIKNKKLRLVYTKLTIKDILNEIKSLFDYFCLLKNLYLNIEIDPRLPKMIITDKNRLSQILVNLLGNAFKFTFSGGITVKARLEDTDPIRIRFSVEDTGIGIKKQDQDRLFKMYGRLEQEDNKVNTHGIGLGLTISNTLAMLLNPKDQKPIQVESELGKGTCFSFIVQSQSSDKESAELSLADISSNILNEDRDATVLKKMCVYTKTENMTKLSTSVPNITYKQQNTLNSDPRPLLNGTDKSSNSIMPLNFEDSSLTRLFRLNTVDPTRKKESSNPQKSSGFPEIPEENPQEPEKPWCLVVDDNPFNLMVACHIMEEREYQVKTGLNGQEAIHRVKEHQAKGQAFKVILMDCQMPIMDGYEATKILREMMKNGECEECPIIALTANNRDEEHDKLCEKVGMSGHVSKPLQIDELEAVLKEVNLAKNNVQQS